MANIEEELQKAHEMREKLTKDINEMKNKNSDLVDDTDINYWSTPVTKMTVATNEQRTKQAYEKLLKNKTEDLNESLKNKNKIKNRISARLTLMDEKGNTGIVKIIGILPEELGYAHELLSQREIGSNEWGEVKGDLEESFNNASATKTTVIVEDTPGERMVVERIVAQMSLQ